MDKKIKKIVALGLGGLVILGGGIAIGSQAFPHTITKEVPVTVTKEVQKLVEVPVEKEVIKEVIVEKNITKEVPVDNEKLAMVETFLWNENGDINYLTHDLKEKEIPMIVDRIIFVNDLKAMAINEVKSEAFNELDGKTVNGTTLVDHKMDRLTLSDDFEDIIMSDIDFDRKDASIKVTGEFEYDDEDTYDVVFKVEFKDGEFDELVVDSVSKQ